MIGAGQAAAAGEGVGEDDEREWTVRVRLCAAGRVRCFVVKTVGPWVASRANMLYLAARTHNRAAVCPHAVYITIVWEFWTDWRPTEAPFLHDHKTSTAGVHPRRARRRGEESSR